MKKLIALLAIAASLSLAAQAQTTTANPGTTFVNSVENYFTSFNTNYTFTGVSLELSSGYKQVAGVNAASELYAQYDLGSFDIAGNFQFSGVGSAINAAELGVGYAFISHYDTKVEASLLGGYDATKNNGQGSAVIEPRISLKKKLTTNTYAETAISLPVYFIGKVNTVPSFYIGVGFTY